VAQLAIEFEFLSAAFGKLEQFFGGGHPPMLLTVML
jgi:hypothetical protein